VAKTVRNQNCIHEEIKSRVNLGNACYHSFQSFLSSCLLCKSLRLKIYVYMYGCETWSLTLGEECRLRVFDSRVLRRIFVPKREKVMRLEKTAQ